MTKVGAYTGPTGPGYPAYCNITIDGDEVIVTVRSDPTIENGIAREGSYARMSLPLAEFEGMLERLK